jgi:hypothetical protein
MKAGQEVICGKCDKKVVVLERIKGGEKKLILSDHFTPGGNWCNQSGKTVG